VLEAIDRSAAQWIAVPYGEHAWTALGLSTDLKIANAFTPWRWAGRDSPPATVTVAYDPAVTSVANRFGTTEGINLIEVPANSYALVDDGTQRIPCHARAQGGDIDVDCNNAAAGTLIVHENNWAGWSVQRDGEPIELKAGAWLSAAAPAGQHHYEFRYRPVDVTIGLLVSAIGVGLALLLLSGAPRRPARPKLPNDASGDTTD